MVFVLSGVLGSASDKLFIAIIVFTLLYFLFFAVIYFAKKALFKLESHTAKKMPDRAVAKSTQKAQYRPRFKD
jgi:Na+-transporting NADH:ubiquinone oxidoreductase subunit NqrF